MTLRQRFSRWIADGKAFCHAFGLPAEDDAGKDLALANYRVYTALLTEQRDAARRELAVYQAQLGQDLDELLGERDHHKGEAAAWKAIAEHRNGVIQGLVAAARSGGFCAICGQPVANCHPTCAVFLAVASIEPVVGSAVEA